MSFTPGQIVFAAIFVLGFILFIALAYGRDKAYISKYYRGSWKILLAILVIIAALWVFVRVISTGS